MLCVYHMFYTAFSVISRLLSIFSLHSTAKSGNWAQIVIPFGENLFPQNMFTTSLGDFGICAIFLCKRKDVKGVEEPQPTGSRSRYEPYWTYQVQDGRLRKPVGGRGHSPPFGLHQREAAIPQSKTADRLNVESKKKAQKKESLHMHSRQMLFSQMIGDSGNVTSNNQCYFMVMIWRHFQRFGKYTSHTFTFTEWSKHT